MPSPSSRASRLSKAEYENTARDLLGATASLGITNQFVADSSSTTFNNNGGDLVVTSAEWQDFQTAAEKLAEQATASTAALTAVAGGTLPADDPGLIKALGRRVFRRPLTSAELAGSTTPGKTSGPSSVTPASAASAWCRSSTCPATRRAGSPRTPSSERARGRAPPRWRRASM